MTEKKPIKFLKNDWKAIVAILGSRGHYSVPITFAKHEKLELFYTDWYFYWGMNKKIRKQFINSPMKILRIISTRFDPRLPIKKVKSFSLTGLLFIIALRYIHAPKIRNYIFLLRGFWFGKSITKFGFTNASFVYGINNESVELFSGAIKCGLACVLEQCSAPYKIRQELLLEETSLWQNWQKGKSSVNFTEFIHREEKEWKIANVILCGSKFVAEGLINCGVSSDKCKIVPYAVDVDQYYPRKLDREKRNDRLKILFLGEICLLKGIQYLYNAIELLDSKSIEVQAAGLITIKQDIAKKIGRKINLLGWLPRLEINRLLNWADVLVLPSICEGSAMVTYEALASGVPVITTPNAGSPVQDGETGFIVPIRDAPAIADRLLRLMKDPQLLHQMSQQARKFAEEQLSWDAYAIRLLSACESVL
ncbi:MAG: glycosyltransferase family 4 protein [Chloroflexi bacterium]|nr:glycosyltransferase family 4 protein [Chloroflexota bacterium]